MDNVLGNNNASFKTFLEKFCNSIDEESEVNHDLPIRLLNRRLTLEDIEGEVLEWCTRYLNSRCCPPTLCAALSREVLKKVLKDDLSSCEEPRPEPSSMDKNSEEDPGPRPVTVLEAESLCSLALDTLNDVCKAWKDDLPQLSPPSKLPQTSVYEIKNTRRKMEDRNVILPDFNTLFDLKGHPSQSYYAVFDGHAGTEAAIFAATHLHCHLAKCEEFKGNVDNAMKCSYKTTDERFILKAERERLKSGSTGISVLIRDSKLHVAWLGDSQAYLVRNGQCLAIMEPHKPERESEKARIEALGGCVVFMGTWRVNGNLAVSRALDYTMGGGKGRKDDEKERITSSGGHVVLVREVWRVNLVLSVSRAIGDIAHKRFITSDADTNTVVLDGSEDYVVLACDGLWDIVQKDELPKLVYDFLQKSNGDKSSIAKQLVEWAKDNGSSDNITVIVVFLRDDIAPPVQQASNFFNFGLAESAEDDPGDKGGNEDRSEDNKKDGGKGRGEDSQRNRTPNSSTPSDDAEQSLAGEGTSGINIVITNKNKYTSKYQPPTKNKGNKSHSNNFKRTNTDKSKGHKHFSNKENLLSISDNVQFSVEEDANSQGNKGHPLSTRDTEPVDTTIPPPEGHVLKKDQVFILEMSKPVDIVPKTKVSRDALSFKSNTVPFTNTSPTFQRFLLDGRDGNDASDLELNKRGSIPNKEILEPLKDYNGRIRKKDSKHKDSVKRLIRKSSFSEPSTWPSTRKNRIIPPKNKLNHAGFVHFTSYFGHAGDQVMNNFGDATNIVPVKKHHQLDPITSINVDNNNFHAAKNASGNKLPSGHVVEQQSYVSKPLEEVAVHPVAMFGSKSLCQNPSRHTKFKSSWRPKRSGRSLGLGSSEVPPSPFSSFKLSTGLEE